MRCELTVENARFMLRLAPILKMFWDRLHEMWI